MSPPPDVDARGVGDTPEWVATAEDAGAAMAGWARQHSLAYERVGLLPAASDYLRTGTQYGVDGWSRSMVQERGVPDGRIRSFSRPKERPVRFSENLCTGILPGGIDGTLAHHSGVIAGGVPGEPGTRLVGTTAVVVLLPEGRRVTRELVGRPHVKGLKVIGPDPEKEQRELSYGEADLTPSLEDQYTWEVWAEDDERPVAELFDAELVEALAGAPDHATVTAREGMLVVEANGYLTDPLVLDSLLRPAALLAERLRRAASRLPRLEPGTQLPRPADTPLRRWTVQGAGTVPWPQPPPDLRTAVSTYESGGPASQPVKRGPLRRFLRSALAPLATPAGSSSRSKAWGLEAFAKGYGHARALNLEDPEELRRRLAFPFPGTAERCLYGRVGGGPEGRLVLWRDGTELGAHRFLNLAIMPAAAGGRPPAPAAPFSVVEVDGWSIVAERVALAGRSVASLDALAAEAARVATR
jgi:hypothetical protein